MLYINDEINFCTLYKFLFTNLYYGIIRYKRSTICTIDATQKRPPLYFLSFLTFFCTQLIKINLKTSNYEVTCNTDICA